MLPAFTVSLFVLFSPLPPMVPWTFGGSFFVENCASMVLVQSVKKEEVTGGEGELTWKKRKKRKKKSNNGIFTMESNWKIKNNLKSQAAEELQHASGVANFSNSERECFVFFVSEWWEVCLSACFFKGLMVMSKERNCWFIKCTAMQVSCNRLNSAIIRKKPFFTVICSKHLKIMFDYIRLVLIGATI